ncbi:MAG: 50S ribosomal protein L9 [Candidatus Doudnabacteria bacterium]|nr:50S ribosomal protein L9 [Candidatus Doudnabacteria bacterium]
MKVILSKDVSSLGRAGEVKEVSNGYARNFLLPKHLALPATTDLLLKVQKEQDELQRKIAKHKQELEALKSKLANKTIALQTKASGQTLFAALHESDIIKAIEQKTKISLKPEQVHLPEPIKKLGTFEITLKLADDISAKIKLEVMPL